MSGPMAVTEDARLTASLVVIKSVRDVRLAGSSIKDSVLLLVLSANT